MNGNGAKTAIESRFSILDTMSSNKNANPPIASLSNLGNTCFLNSVLYTLRFTPGFLHSLHHLVYDLGLQGGVQGKKRPSGSNGTNISNGGIADADTELVHDVVDQLHDLFKNMSCSDETPETNREPIPPNSFLQAVGKLNPMFEGNQQQDAHELLVTVLNTLQDIKIPVPPASLNNGSAAAAAAADAVDSSSSKEDGKKSKNKKSGKSIFYSGNSSQQQQPTNLFYVSNGLRSSTSKLDQINNGVNAIKSSTSSMTLQNAEAQLLPNFVKENFVGKSVMRTRCLECEASTYRSETFTNIDIPLTFDDQDEPDPMSVKDLFLKQIMASETLRENNKYWCSECSRLNEAQRSVQYEILPRVMVLQLKRFTATGNKSYTSKINEYIPTPFTMNCFCTQCMPNGGEATVGSSKHHYRLYAVIMHLGATLASGHYTAYVRAGEQALDYLQCNRSNSVERKNKSGKGIMKYFSRSERGLSGSQGNGINGSGGGVVAHEQQNACKSANCCGVRTSNQLSMGDASSSTSTASMGSNPAPQRSLDSLDSGTCHDYANGSNGGGQPDLDETWLECDDETIHVISRRQFEEDLSCNRGFTTPYLLFYQRI